MSTVNKNNTKAQILTAYEALLKEVSEKSQDNPKEVQQRKQAVEVVENATNTTEGSILEHLTTIKSSFLNSLEKIEETLLEERKKLETIQEAIKIEEKKLEDLYGISSNADALATILLVQKEQKELFEEEMNSQKSKLTEEITITRTAWEKEKLSNKEKLEEEKELIKKTKKREEEEYKYNLEQKRKKEEDEYLMKKNRQEIELKEQKIVFEKEFTEREKNIKESEKELLDLRKAVAEHSKQLENVVIDTKKETETRLLMTYKYEKDLQKKETEGIFNLKNHQIKSLEEKIKEMENQLKEAGVKVDISEKTVKDIALKAIENTTKTQLIERERSVKE